MQSTHSSSSQPSTSVTATDEKVLQDLSVLAEQISLCQSMLVNAGGQSSIDANEALLTVIGFLEACVPRMVELIEAAAQGALAPETFEQCFVVNDKLTNILADVDKDPKDRQPLTSAAASSAGAAAAAAGDSTGGEHTDIDQSMNNLSVADGGDSGAMLGGKTTGLDFNDIMNDKTEEDPFAGGPDLLAPTPASNPFTISESFGSTESAEAAAKKGNGEDDDDFDAFFKDRTAAS